LHAGLPAALPETLAGIARVVVIALSLELAALAAQVSRH